MTDINFALLSAKNRTQFRSDIPIIMMHGWGQSLNSMRLLGELLSNFFTVYILDLPGFGKSPKPETDWDTCEYAVGVRAFAESKGISKCFLIGHSFGGRVSVRLASMYPDLVAGVVLINSGGLKRELKFPKNIRAKSIGILSKSVKAIDSMTGSKLFQEWFIPKFASLDYKNAGDMRNILVKAVNEDLTQDSQLIKCPTFILWGKNDTETPLECGQRFHALIKDSQFVALPGKDHFPFIDEGAHICAHYIAPFLQSVNVEIEQEEKACV